jgi:hypothetical protein
MADVPATVRGRGAVRYGIGMAPLHADARRHGQVQHLLPEATTANVAHRARNRLLDSERSGDRRSRSRSRSRSRERGGLTLRDRADRRSRSASTDHLRRHNRGPGSRSRSARRDERGKTRRHFHGGRSTSRSNDRDGEGDARFQSAKGTSSHQDSARGGDTWRRGGAGAPDDVAWLGRRRSPGRSRWTHDRFEERATANGRGDRSPSPAGAPFDPYSQVRVSKAYSNDAPVALAGARGEREAGRTASAGLGYGGSPVGDRRSSSPRPSHDAYEWKSRAGGVAVFVRPAAALAAAAAARGAGRGDDGSAAAVGAASGAAGNR